MHAVWGEGRTLEDLAHEVGLLGQGRVEGEAVSALLELPVADPRLGVV
eukprot:COSAG01_NODE_59376_length_300_cov_1.522388_1_plen_47_part_10